MLSTKDAYQAIRFVMIINIVFMNSSIFCNATIFHIRGIYILFQQLNVMPPEMTNYKKYIS